MHQDPCKQISYSAKDEHNPVTNFCFVKSRVMLKQKSCCLSYKDTAHCSCHASDTGD